MTLSPRLSLFLAVACLAACATAPKPPVATTPPAASSTTPVAARPVTPAAEPRGEEAKQPGPLAQGPIYYELESARLRPESQRALDRLAEELRRRPNATVDISGHTCELGTAEFNLALGQQRANVARDYLVRLGVEPERVSTVSYGEERPSDTGSGEAAWSRNRRSEFSFTVTHAGLTERN
jgi:peptidoglycan-associated lipoprotein